jgi:hypothetical protein
VTCPTCGRDASSRYCPACGERQLRPGDLTLGHLLGQAIETITNTDGRVFGSVRDLLIRPGKLTSAYIEGRRKPYIAPLPLFLVTNVAFFAVQSVAGWRVFSTPLYLHLSDQLYSGLARTMVADRLAAMQTTLERYAPAFDQAAALNAKSLIVLMVPPFALVVWLLLGRRGRPIMTHVVFALHFFGFVLLLYCIGFPIAKLASGLSDSVLDRTMLVIHLVSYAVYLWVAVGTVYGARGISRGLTSVTLTAAAIAGLLAYRFEIFLITLYTT